MLTTDGGGKAVVMGLGARPGAHEVFNIEVAGPHNYFVQAAESDAPGVLVHNKPFDPDQRALIDLCNEATLGGRRGLPWDDFLTIAEWAAEYGAPFRAGPTDLAGHPGTNWDRPHFHLRGCGRGGHVPLAGVP